MSTIGVCSCCSETGRVERDVCARCINEYGERMAHLIARARVETGFAQACAERMTPEARQEFMQTLAGPRVRPMGGPRKAQDRGEQNSATDQGLLRSSGDRSRK